MPKPGIWCLFVILFAAVILGLFSLDNRPNPVALPGTKTKASVPASAALRHLHCQPKHWRALIMQQ